MSSIEIEMPARVASRKPLCSSRSANTTVSFRPQRRNDVLISREISFFFSVLLMLENGRPLGRISDSSARPTVVSTSCVSGTKPPSLSRSFTHSVRRTDTRAVISTMSLSSARCNSAMSLNTMPSPRPLMRSRVA